MVSAVTIFNINLYFLIHRAKFGLFTDINLNHTNLSNAKGHLTGEITRDLAYIHIHPKQKFEGNITEKNRSGI